MTSNLDLNFVIAFLFGLLLLYLLARVLYVPFKIGLKLLGNAVVGGIVLALFNVLGSFWGITIGINIFTVFLTGFLGIPGIILLLVVQNLTA